MPLQFFHHRLDNGLQIVAELNATSHSFAAGLFVRTGSRDETSQLNGVSHFLEHMLFKGSASLDWQAMNRVFDEMGARYNAFTTQEMTAYYGNVLPEFTDKLLAHLGQLFEPLIREEDFVTEKKVILEEIAMYNDEPGQRVYEKLMEAHFAPHPLGMSVIGTDATINAMQRDQMADYFKARYGPGNTVLSVSGNMDFDHIVKAATRLYGHWTNQQVDRIFPEPTPSGRKLSLVDAKVNRAYVMTMTSGPSAQDDDRFAAKVLEDVLGDAEGSRLYWALVDPAIAEDADFGFYPHDRCGSFYLSLITDPAKAQQALSIANRELKRVRQDITEAEVTRARNKLASSITLGSESPMGRMRAVGSEWIYTSHYRSLEDDMAVLESITADTLGKLLDKYDFEPMTMVSLSPVEVLL